VVIWPVLAGTGKTADLVLACFGRFRSQRVKMIIYILIGSSELDITIYPPEGDPPADWWDTDADKSLMVGVFKHGKVVFFDTQTINKCFKISLFMGFML